jgi:hypothetical protein
MRQAFASGYAIQQAFGTADGLCNFVSREGREDFKEVGAATQSHRLECVNDF